MKYIDINGKLIRKDPIYYIQDIFNFPEYDGDIDRLYEFLIKIEEETTIHIINTGCMTPLLFEVLKKVSDKSKYISVEVD